MPLPPTKAGLSLPTQRLPGALALRVGPSRLSKGRGLGRG